MMKFGSAGLIQWFYSCALFVIPSLPDYCHFRNNCADILFTSGAMSSAATICVRAFFNGCGLLGGTQKRH